MRQTSPTGLVTSDKAAKVICRQGAFEVAYAGRARSRPWLASPGNRAARPRPRDDPRRRGLRGSQGTRRAIETYETKVGPHNGARFVAKAWSDSVYKTRQLKDATTAIAELGLSGRQGEHMVAAENTRKVHNLVVCTLCSCYPWPVLGLPPVWYKSAPYRSRAVMDPRSVLADFGITPSGDKEIRVWDSTAENRYLVLPEPPPGTDGWNEEQLAALVTRDSMIGTGLAVSPGEL
jgi:nitrile hydratase subunit alpha